MRAGRAHRGADELVVRHVVDEDIGELIRVAGHQVGRVRMEGHEAAVAGDGRSVGVAVALRPIRGQGDTGRGPGLPVVHEDVLRIVRVTCDQVRRVGLESDVAAIARDGQAVVGAVVGLCPV